MYRNDVIYITIPYAETSNELPYRINWILCTIISIPNASSIINGENPVFAIRFIIENSENGLFFPIFTFVLPVKKCFKFKIT